MAYLVLRRATMSVSPRTQGCGRRAALTSLITSTSELALLCVCALWVTGAALVAARWVIGLLGSTAGYVINRRWTFRQRTARGPQFRRFALTLLTAVTLATTLFGVIVARSSWDPRLVHVVTAAAVFVSFTQPMLKRWVFPRPT